MKDKEKLTDEQIIKALEQCVGSNTCGDCPLLKIKENCRPFLYKEALNLINRLKEENTILKDCVQKDNSAKLVLC